MENNAVSCKLKIPKTLDDKAPLFLAKFSNGNVNVNNSQTLTFKCCRHASDEGKVDSTARRVLCASNGRLNYSSETLDCRNGDDAGHMQYFVGVRNKSTGRMKVYDSVSFLLKPDIKRKSMASSSEEKDIREKLDDLTLNFGSKGKQRSIVARLKYSNVNSMGHNIDDIDDMNDFKETTTTKPPVSSTNIEYIPPQNRGANCASEVYNITDVISSEADQFLTKRAEQLLKDLPSHLSQWEADNEYCEYILQHMTNELTLEKAKYLLYYHYLWKFSQFLSPEFRKKDPATDIPEPVRSNLLEWFTVVSSGDNKKPVRSFPLLMKDKLLAYMTVLALFVDDYKINLALLQKNSKHSMSKIEKMAQTLGCYVSTRKVGNLNVKFAELRVPLNYIRQYLKK